MTAADDPYGDLLLGGPTLQPERATWIAISAVTTTDGVIAVRGSSRGIGGPGDRVAMRRIRRGADAVLVGAGTVRAEGYDAAMTGPEDVSWRRERGLADRPALVVATRSGDLGAFGAGVRESRVVLLGPLGAGVRLDDLRGRLRAGGSTLEVLDPDQGDGPGWPHALRVLRDAGIRRVACEGGPTLNAQLLAAGVVDEVLLTVAPRILGVAVDGTTTAGFAGGRTFGGRLELRSAIPVGDEVLLRYAVVPAAAGD